MAISFWITIFQERWKRKQNELRLIWGTSLTKQKEDIRSEFQGNEEFSHSNNQVNRKDVQKKGLVFKFVNIFIVIFFVGLCVSSFLLTKDLAGSGDSEYA